MHLHQIMMVIMIIFIPVNIGENGYNMKIYNRWGQIIYNKDDGIWDGSINGNAVQKGLYSYSILVNDFKNKPFVYTRSSQSYKIDEKYSSTIRYSPYIR